MSKNITGGALGGGALKRISNIIRNGRLGLGGVKKIHINEVQGKEIIKMAGAVFGKKGKSSNKISGYAFEKEENNLALKHVHGFNSKQAAEVNEALGLTVKTKEVSNNYAHFLQQEKAKMRQERMSKVEKIIPSFENKRGALKPEARLKAYESKIHYDDKILTKKRDLAELQAEIAANRKKANDNRFNEGKKDPGVSHEKNRYTESNKELSEIRPGGREVSQPAPGRGDVPHEAPRRDSLPNAPAGHTENVRPPGEFGK